MNIMTCRNVFSSDFCPICYGGNNHEKKTKDSEDEDDISSDVETYSNENSFENEKKWWEETLTSLKRDRRTIMAQYLTAVSKFQAAMIVDDLNDLNRDEDSYHFQNALTYMELQLQSHQEEEDRVATKENLPDRLKIENKMKKEIRNLIRKVRQSEERERRSECYNKRMNDDITKVMEELTENQNEIQKHQDQKPTIHHICMKEFEDKALGKTILNPVETHWACRTCLKKDIMWGCHVCRAERTTEPEDVRIRRISNQMDQDSRLASEMRSAIPTEFQNPVFNDAMSDDESSQSDEDSDADSDDDYGDDYGDDEGEYIDLHDIPELNRIFRQDNINNRLSEQVAPISPNPRESDEEDEYEKEEESESDHSFMNDETPIQLGELSIHADSEEDSNSDDSDDDENLRSYVPTMPSVNSNSTHDIDNDEGNQGTQNVSLSYTNSEHDNLTILFDSEDETEPKNHHSMDDSKNNNNEELGDLSDSEDVSSDSSDSESDTERMEDVNRDDTSDNDSIHYSDDIGDDDDEVDDDNRDIDREMFRNGDKMMDDEEQDEEDEQVDFDDYDKYYWSFLDTYEEIKNQENGFSTQHQINHRFAMWKSQRRKKFDSKYRSNRQNLLKSFGDSGLSIKDYVAKINLLLLYEKPTISQKTSMQTTISKPAKTKKPLWDQPPSQRRKRKSGWDMLVSEDNRKKTRWDQLPSPRIAKASRTDGEQSRWDQPPSPRIKKGS